MGDTIRLSDNFTLAELTKTSTGLKNIPSDDDIQRLYYLCQFILQPIRDMAGPVIVLSGYRSEEVNNAVKGVKNSQHLRGEAADIILANYPKGTERIFQAIFHLRDAWIDRFIWGQAILENRNGAKWIHVSLPRIGKKNGEILKYENGKYKKYNPK